MCVGDDKWIFSVNTSNPYGIIAGGNLWNLFTYYELKEIMRQRDDCNFANALKAMATGTMENSQIELIKSGIDSNTILPIDVHHLFWSNAEAEQYNTLRLRSLKDYVES